MEAIHAELRDLFQDLKKSSHADKTVEEKTQESGDTTEKKDPLKSQFETLLSKLDEAMQSKEKGSSDFIKFLSMKASLMYEKAKINLSNELMANSQELLQNSLTTIEEYANDPQITFLYLRIINHLSYILSRNGELDKAKDLLEKVIQDDPKNVIVYSTEDLFTDNKIDEAETTLKLNKLVINNMQMLGWVYGKLGLYESHTSMQHKSLQKQLDTSDGDMLQWATRCFRLATLFLTQCQWVHARYHLAAAETMLNRLEREVSTNPEINKAQADLARAWIHYGLHLFSTSKKTILDRIYGKEEVTNLQEDEYPTEEDLPEAFQFQGISVVIPEVPAVHVYSTLQARALFIHTQKWLKRARLYYTLRDYPLQYVNAILDLSELYRFLAFYEPDLDSQYSVQKKRSDALETLCTILKDVRPNCYIAVSVELLRELAEVQIELMGINLKRLCHAESITMTQSDLKQRINAVGDIRSKLETVGDIMTNYFYDNDDDSDGGEVQSENSNEPEEAQEGDSKATE